MRKEFGASEKVRRLRSTLPDSEEGTMYGAPALKWRGKMFACMATHRSAEPDTLAVRLPVVERDRLLRSNPEIFYVKPHYLDYPCVLVRLGRISERGLVGILHLGWRFVSSGAKR